jgi:thioredoxin
MEIKMDELKEIRKMKMEKLKKDIERSQIKIKIEADDNNFDEMVIKQSNNAVVVVDYWAEWCIPCLMLGPVLERIAEQHNGKIILAKVNVDKNPKLSQMYNIDSIPAVKIFKRGKIVGEFIGALPEPHVKRHIEKHLDD